MLLSFQRPARLVGRGLLRKALPGGTSPPEGAVKSSASGRGLNPPNDSPSSTAAAHCSRASRRAQPPKAALADLQHAPVQRGHGKVQRVGGERLPVEPDGPPREAAPRLGARAA